LYDCEFHGYIDSYFTQKVHKCNLTCKRTKIEIYSNIDKINIKCYY
jgi:hypothetical protein